MPRGAGKGFADCNAAVPAELAAVIFCIIMFFFGFIIGVVIVAIIMHRYMTSKIGTTKSELEQVHKDLLKSELAAKDVTIADLEKEVAHHKGREKSFASRWQQLTDRENKVKEKERDLERRERELEQRRQSLLKDNEEIITRKVEEGIKGKQKGIDKNWVHIMRKAHKLEEDEQKIYERAVLIADHLGVSLKCILDRREKKLVDQLVNELTEERYALMDLVMSCPEYRVKHLLEWMQRFPRS